MLNFLKGCKNIYIGKEIKCKTFIEAIYWIVRTGAQWRELPEYYGKWNSVFSRFNDWSKKDIWKKLMEFVSVDHDLEYIMLDSTIVRANASAAGYGKQENEGLGRSSGGFSSKIHVKVDALGNPLKFIITPGQHSDITQANDLLQDIGRASYIIADKGYNSSKLREEIIKQGAKPVIPSKRNSINPIEYDKYIYKERHLVECFFSKIKYFRRIFSRFDKSARNFIGFLEFVGTCIWLK